MKFSLISVVSRSSLYRNRVSHKVLFLARSSIDALMSIFLPTRPLHLIPHFRQLRYHFIAMVALNFDIAVLDSATGAAQLLELLRQGGQLRLASLHPIDYGNGLPSASFPVAHDAHDAVALLLRRGIRGVVAAALLIGLAAPGAVCDPAAIG